MGWEEVELEGIGIIWGPGHSHWEFGTRQNKDSRSINPSTMDSGGRQETAQVQRDVRPSD